MTSAILACLLVGLPVPPGRPLYVEGPTGTIVGRVIEQATQRPVRDAVVVVDGAGWFTMTSKDGTFTVNRVPLGIHTVRIKARGLRAMEVHGLCITANATAYIPMVVLRNHPYDSCPGEFDVVQAGDRAFVVQMLDIDLLPRLPPPREQLLPLPSRPYRWVRRERRSWEVFEEPHGHRVVSGNYVSWEDVREQRAMRSPGPIE